MIKAQGYTPQGAQGRNDDDFDASKYRNSDSAGATYYSKDIVKQIYKGVAEGLYRNKKEVFRFPEHLQSAVITLLHNPDTKEAAARIFDQFLVLKNNVDFFTQEKEKNTQTKEKGQIDVIRKHAKTLINILQEKNIQNALAAVSSDDMSVTNYECSEFLRGKYPFLTLDVAWLHELPDTVSLSIGTNNLFQIETSSAFQALLFAKTPEAEQYRTLIKEYGQMYQETVKVIDNAVNTIINSGISELPQITNRREFFIDNWLYIYTNKKILDLLKEIGTLPQAYRKQGYEITNGIKKAQHKHNDADSIKRETRIEKLRTSKNKNRQHLGEICDAVNGREKKQGYHRDNMETAFADNMYYEIYSSPFDDREKGESMLIEKSIPIPQGEKGDEFWFLEHSQFEDNQEERLDAMHLVWQLHEKEKEVLKRILAFEKRVAFKKGK